MTTPPPSDDEDVEPGLPPRPPRPRVYFPLPRSGSPTDTPTGAPADPHVDPAAPTAPPAALPGQSSPTLPGFGPPGGYPPWLRSSHTGYPGARLPDGSPAGETPIGGVPAVGYGQAGGGLPPGYPGPDFGYQGGDPAAAGFPSYDIEPPEPTPRRKSPVWVRIVTIAAVILIIGAIALMLQRNSRFDAATGDCLKVETGNEYSQVDCSAPDAGYRVLSVEDATASACADPDVDYTVSQTGAGAKSWCLELVVRVGDCITARSAHIDCAEAKGSSFKVTAVLAGTQDREACPSGSSGRVYLRDNRVMCFEQNG